MPVEASALRQQEEEEAAGGCCALPCSPHLSRVHPTVAATPGQVKLVRALPAEAVIAFSSDDIAMPSGCWAGGAATGVQRQQSCAAMPTAWPRPPQQPAVPPAPLRMRLVLLLNRASSPAPTAPSHRSQLVH